MLGMYTDTCIFTKVLVVIYVLVAPLLLMFLLFYMQKSQVLKLLKSEYRDLSGGTQGGVEVLTAYAIQGCFSLFYHASIQH